jgi:hypothetical protein
MSNEREGGPSVDLRAFLILIAEKVEEAGNRGNREEAARLLMHGAGVLAEQAEKLRDRGQEFLNSGAGAPVRDLLAWAGEWQEFLNSGAGAIDIGEDEV